MCTYIKLFTNLTQFLLYIFHTTFFHFRKKLCQGPVHLLHKWHLLHLWKYWVFLIMCSKMKKEDFNKQWWVPFREPSRAWESWHIIKVQAWLLPWLLGLVIQSEHLTMCTSKQVCFKLLLAITIISAFHIYGSRYLRMENSLPREVSFQTKTKGLL